MKLLILTLLIFSTQAFASDKETALASATAPNASDWQCDNASMVRLQSLRQDISISKTTTDKSTYEIIPDKATGEYRLIFKIPKSDLRFKTAIVSKLEIFMSACNIYLINQKLHPEQTFAPPTGADGLPGVKVEIPGLIKQGKLKFTQMDPDSAGTRLTSGAPMDESLRAEFKMNANELAEFQRMNSSPLPSGGGLRLNFSF